MRAPADHVRRDPMPFTTIRDPGSWTSLDLRPGLLLTILGSREPTLSPSSHWNKPTLCDEYAARWSGPSEGQDCPQPPSGDPVRVPLVMRQSNLTAPTQSTSSRSTCSYMDSFLIRQQANIVVLLVLMLHHLAQMVEGAVAVGAAVRLLRDSTLLVTVRQELVHERTHSSLALSKLVDLCASVVLAKASSTEPALNVLDRIRTRAETAFSSDGACNVSRTMDLLVHLQGVCVLKDLVAGRAYKSHAVFAARLASSFAPLTRAVPVRVALISTLHTHSIACQALDAATRVLAKLVAREEVSREIVSAVGAVDHDGRLGGCRIETSNTDTAAVTGNRG